MFSNLRQGSQIHILHDGATPYVEIGFVETASNMSLMGYYPNVPSLPIDISVKVGEKVTTYQQLPPNAECARVTERNTSEQVLIACSKEAVNNELQTMKQKSIETINSVPYHEQKIKAIDVLIGQLNPEIREKQAQAQEINDLKSQLASMNEMIVQLTSQLGEKASSKTTRKE